MWTPPIDPILDAAVGRLTRSWAFFEEQLMETVRMLTTSIDRHLLETDQMDEYQERPPRLPHALAYSQTKELFRLARAEARHRRVPAELRQRINRVYRQARGPLRLRNRMAHSRSYMEEGRVYGLTPVERAMADERYEAILRTTPDAAVGSPTFKSRVRREVWSGLDAVPLDDLGAAAVKLDELTLDLRKISRALFDQTFGTPDVLFPGILDSDGRPLNRGT